MKIKEVTDATDGQKEAIKRQEKEIRKKIIVKKVKKIYVLEKRVVQKSLMYLKHSFQEVNAKKIRIKKIIIYP